MNLQGLRVVLTRPEGQNESLAAAIRAAGGEATIFPVLRIADIEDLEPLKKIVERLADYDLAIFISPNATQRAMARINERGAWPAQLPAATIGPVSAQALRDHGVAAVLLPQDRYDSENLLALPALQSVQDRRIVIFRGQGGRELLGDTLRERGAQVDYAECYRRVIPQVDMTAFKKKGAAGGIDAIVLTSSEGLRNLHTMLGQAALPWLLNIPLLLPHARIAEHARVLGHTEILATPPGDEGLLSALGVFSARVGDRRTAKS